MDIVKALKFMCPGAEWSLSGDAYEGLEWRDLRVQKPSEQDIADAYTRVMEQEAMIEYRQRRAAAYPPLGDQLDMIWHAMDAQIIPVATEFYDAIKSVKDAFPDVG